MNDECAYELDDAARLGVLRLAIRARTCARSASGRRSKGSLLCCGSGYIVTRGSAERVDVGRLQDAPLSTARACVRSVSERERVCVCLGLQVSE